MPVYRVTIQRITSEREILEVSGTSAADAATRADRFADSRRSTRGITVLRSFEDDPNSTVLNTVVQITEK